MLVKNKSSVAAAGEKEAEEAAAKMTSFQILYVVASYSGSDDNDEDLWTEEEHQSTFANETVTPQDIQSYIEQLPPMNSS